MRNDRPVHPWSRRQALSVLAVGGAWLSYGATVRGQSAGAPCLVRPTQTEGPYFVDGQLHRSDIRSDPTNGAICAGTPLALTMLVSRLDAGGCRPLPNAVVDLWHCDAQGIYSGVRDPMFDTAGAKFLRGFQRTDADGRARFVTIYPGGYRGRAVHIHFKIRTEQKRGYEFTSQLYFDDALTARVHSAVPYVERKTRLTRNEDDSIFRRNGADLMLAPVPGEAGYSASFPIALDLS